MDNVHMTLGVPFYWMLLLVTTGFCHFPDPNIRLDRCLRTDETLSWNRTFHFNNHSLNLTLEVTDRPSHWILNYIFAIIAHERLGYQNITFVERTWSNPSDSINRLMCPDENCTELPEAHVNLEVWLPLGTTPSFWAPPTKVTDHGPLGPVSRWALLLSPAFVSQTQNLQRPNLESTCDPVIRSAFRQNREAFGTSLNLGNAENHSVMPNVQSNATAKMLSVSWYMNGVDSVQNCDRLGSQSSTTQDWQPSSTNFFSPYCRFEAQQATKLTWAKLQRSVPLIHQLVSRINLTQAEYDGLLNAVGFTFSDIVYSRYADFGVLLKYSSDDLCFQLIQATKPFFRTSVRTAYSGPAQDRIIFVCNHCCPNIPVRRGSPFSAICISLPLLQLFPQCGRRFSC